MHIQAARKQGVPVGELPSVGKLLGEAVECWGSRIALRRRRVPLQWSVMTWTELGGDVRSVACGLMKLGVEAGDRVALLGNTRLEWTLVDYGILSIGAVSVPLYHSEGAEYVRYVLADSGASVIVVEDRAQLDKVLEHRDALPDLKGIVVMEVMDLREVPGAYMLDELMREGRRYLRKHRRDFAARYDAVQRSDLATIVYTSGTTGVAKGVELNHGNLLGAVESLAPMLPHVGPDDTTILFLPLSHIYARLAQFFALQTGFGMAYAQRVDNLGEVLREVRPTFFFAVPRIYERIYQQVAGRYRSLSPVLKSVFRESLAAARERRRVPYGTRRHEGREGRKVRSLRMRARQAVGDRMAERMIFEPMRESMGGRLRFCVSGGAPMNADVARFFRLAGIEILEGYGLSETVGATTINPLGENRIGTVGRPLKNVRVRISADGEVLIKGVVVFRGYRGLPEETASVIDDEGWLHTGDAGAFDEAGYLTITGRKKDLLITSGAKNVAPQRVEGILRQSPYIANALVFGDRRPHLVALLTLTRKELEQFAVSVGLKTGDWAALLRDPRVTELVDAEVERCNAKLARYEQVRAHRILPRQFSLEEGELTPTLKVRRRAVAERYQHLIEAMYGERLPV